MTKVRRTVSLYIHLLFAAARVDLARVSRVLHAVVLGSCHSSEFVLSKFFIGWLLLEFAEQCKIC